MGHLSHGYVSHSQRVNVTPLGHPTPITARLQLSKDPPPPAMDDSLNINSLWRFFVIQARNGRIRKSWKCGFVWKCCVPLNRNGFADHYPYEKWLFHWELTQHFQVQTHVQPDQREEKSNAFLPSLLQWPKPLQKHHRKPPTSGTMYAKKKCFCSGWKHLPSGKLTCWPWK